MSKRTILKQPLRGPRPKVTADRILLAGLAIAIAGSIATPVATTIAARFDPQDQMFAGKARDYTPTGTIIKAYDKAKGDKPKQ